MGVIYLRTNKVNGKKYVGQVITRRFKARQNKWKNPKYHYAGKAINAARAKYGIEAFDFEILKECDDKELDFWEKYYIKELNTKVPYGYNMTDGGDASWVKGKHLSEEWKRKIGEGNKGKKRSTELIRKIVEAHKGKHLSEEHKKKISISTKKSLSSTETRIKMSEAHKGEKHWLYGKHHTEETREKLSEAKKGISNVKLSKPVLQIDKDTNEVISEFPSVSEVERQLEISISNVSNCCNGKRNIAGGYKWQYK